MMEHWNEPQERDYSDRFDRGVRQGQDAEETRAFQSYEHIRQRLHTYSIPHFNHTQLSQQMAAEMKRPKYRPFGWLGWIERIPTPAFAGACAIVLMVVIAVSIFYMKQPKVRVIISAVTTRVISNGTLPSLPWFWESRLQQGKLVTVPYDKSLTLMIFDGSIVTCAPGTQLAVPIKPRKMGERRERCIVLEAGKITVQAKSIPNSTLTVETPLLDVEVVGTVFTVTVNR